MSPELINMILWSTLDTLTMVALAGIFGTLAGLPLGIFLATSRAGELFPAPNVNRLLGLVVNATRSTPFIILVVAIVPLTRLIAGTSIGTSAAVVPLTIAATPFIAGSSKAPSAKSIRASSKPRVPLARARCRSSGRCLLPEAMPAVTLALTLATVSLIGYSAMVGAVGGGGLGDLGIRYGYQRFMPEVMATVVAVLICLVQGVQSLGDFISRRLDKRTRHS
jgi:D-methionine transport system permease protein